MFGFGKPTTLPEPGKALPGREQPIPTAQTHGINGVALKPPYPEGSEIAEFALGCFWGEEKLYWEQPGVIVTAVGYEGGITPNPTYEEVCSGKTGHVETVRIVYDPEQGLDAELGLRAHDCTRHLVTCEKIARNEADRLRQAIRHVPGQKADRA